MSRPTLTPGTISIVLGSPGAAIALLYDQDLLAASEAFFITTCLMALYVGAQVAYLRQAQSGRWMVNPVVLCSAVTFGLGFGIGNLLFFLPTESLEILGMVPEVSPSMAKFMLVVMLACVAMWQGYWSWAGSRLAHLIEVRGRGTLVKRTNQLRPLAVPTLLGVSVAARLAMINLGLYGYSSSYDDLVSAGGYTQYLFIAASLGKLALVAASLQFFMTGRNRTQWVLVLCIELAFGLLSGFKSQVAIPFAIAGICQYIASGRFPRRWVAAFAIGIFVAYAVIEPFRAIRNEDPNFRGTSVADIASAVIRSATLDDSTAGDTGRTSILLSFLARSSYAYVGSLGIDFVDKGIPLPENSPQFLENIFLAPAHAWIPRFIWATKPVGDLGFWYTRAVVGYQDSFSATSMTPVTYLYFAGGTLAIALGFFVLGILQRGVFAFCGSNPYVASSIVFLGVLHAVVIPPDGFGDLLITILRELPLLVIVQHLMIRATPPSDGAQSHSRRMTAAHSQGGA